MKTYQLGMELLLIKQRYNFESNSQQTPQTIKNQKSCCLSSKDTISKAIHNLMLLISLCHQVVAYQAKIQFRKQFTTLSYVIAVCAALLLIKQRYNFESNSQPLPEDRYYSQCCCLSSKDTISKAIHN